MSFKDVQLADVRLFVFAAEKGTLAAAATALGVPRASASRQLQRLETTLGRSVLHRGSGRFALTEEGRIFLPSALRMLASMDQVVDALRSQEGPLEGTLRISAPLAYGRTNIAPCIADFLTLHPGVNITLDLGSHRVDLLADEADLAVLVGEVGGETLVARLLATEAVTLCAAPAYLDTAGQPEQLDELTQHRVLALASIDPAPDLTLHHRDGTHTICGHIALRSNDPAVLAAAARQGLGIAYVPTSSVVADLQAGTLVAVLPDLDLLPLSVNVVYAPGRRHSRKVRAFLDFLIEQIKPGEVPSFPAGVDARKVAR